MTAVGAPGFFEGTGGVVIHRFQYAVTSYCSGDGSGTACPCANSGGASAGCANSTGVGAELDSHGSTEVSEDELAFDGFHLRPGQPVLLFAGTQTVNGGSGVVFGDGLRCAGGGVVRLGTTSSDASGHAAWGPGLVGAGGWSAGDTRTFQCWYRDPGGPCDSGFNLSQGLRATFLP